jgi:hypothetical protein
MEELHLERTSNPRLHIKPYSIKFRKIPKPYSRRNTINSHKIAGNSPILLQGNSVKDLSGRIDLQNCSEAFNCATNPQLQAHATTLSSRSKKIYQSSTTQIANMKHVQHRELCSRRRKPSIAKSRIAPQADYGKTIEADRGRGQPRR